MKLGLIISMVFHGCLLAFALFSLTTAKALKPMEVKSIPMEIVDISELTKLKAGLKKAPEKKETKQKDKKPVAKEIKKAKKKKPAPKRAVQPVAERQDPAPVKKPKHQKKEPKPVKKKVAKKPKPKPKVKPKPKPKAKIVKKKRKKKKFNEDKIAALLNKVPDSGPTASKLPDLPGAKKVKGNPQGKHIAMSISEIDAFRRQVSQCWNPPVGGLGAEDLRVKLRLQLRKDGSLKGQPRILNSGGRSSFHRAAADSAARAVWQCQPYNLPARKYDTWKDMILNFNPRDMLRG